MVRKIGESEKLRRRAEASAARIMALKSMYLLKMTDVPEIKSKANDPARYVHASWWPDCGGHDLYVSG